MTEFTAFAQLGLLTCIGLLVMLCDTYSGGKWQFVVDGPHKGARLMDVHIVRKSA